jgi:glycosyltransferase involved in cell wall biosynthesis
MNIAIEAFSLSLDKITGVGNVALNYIDQLQKCDQMNKYFIYTSEALKHIQITNRNWTHVRYLPWLKKAKLSARETWLKMTNKYSTRGFAFRAFTLTIKSVKMLLELLTRLYFPIWLIRSFNNNQIDVFIATSPEWLPLFMIGITYRIGILYDLVWILYPETMQFKALFKRLMLRHNLKRLDILISISDNTKKDAIEKLKLRAPVITIPLAADRNIYYFAGTAEIRNVQKKYGITKKYILSVCTLEPRKNLASLITAYEKMPGQEQFQLVLVGMPGWIQDDFFKSIGKLRLKRNIILTGYVPASDLAGLYTGAEVFVFPSLYEGFGLPVLEAMQCGCPVIASNSSSIPEVVGDAGILVDPLDTTALASAIYQVIINTKIRKSLRQKGIIRSREFSWEKTAKKLLRVINSL